MEHVRSTTTVALSLMLLATAIGDSAEKRPAQRHRSSLVPDVVFIPTPRDVVAKMLELAAVRREDVVYDLGCGDGRIVVMAARTYGCHAVGFDIDPRRVKESQASVKRNQVQHLVRIEQRDVLGVDLRPASIVTLYLSPKLNAKLVAQFETLKAGSRIVSHESTIPGLKPDKIVQVSSKEDRRAHTIFLWTSPLRKGETKGHAP